MKKIIEKMKYTAIWAMALSFVLAGCQTEKNMADEWGEDGVRLRFAASRLSGETVSGDDAQIGNLKGFRMVGNQVAEVFDNLILDENGWCALKPAKREGTLYFVANGSQVNGLESVTTLDELLALQLTGSEMTAEGVAMTGKLELSGSLKPEVNMKRSVARVDVDAKSAGVEVKKVVLGNVADRGMLWNETSVLVLAEQAQMDERSFVFEVPVAGKKETVCYLYEQANDNLTVHITADVEGVTYELDTKLPVGIRRNTVYTLKVNGVGGKLDVEVQEADWGGTDEVTAGEEKLEFTVDAAASSLPEGVTVNDRLDQVNVPYTATEFNLVMNTMAGTTLKMSGKVDGVEVTELPASRASENQLTIHVESALKSFTDLGGSIQLQAVNKEGVSVGEIALNFDANPCRLTGDLVFDQNNYCRFDKNIEGELAVLFVPENMSAELRFEIPENVNKKNWMKMEQRADGSYRLLAGWCTTYKQAMNGQTEAVQLVITDENGKEAIYTITRVYRSIPTVLVDGKYWSMFPMVGNSKKLAEQIDMEIAPNDLMNHLMTCSDEEFIRLQGSHYQGGNPQAITIQYNTERSQFDYNGFSEAVTSMGLVNDEDMLPEGWRLPTHDDIGALSWGNGAAFKYWDGVSTTYKSKNHNVRERKDVMVDEQNYGTAYVWGIKINGSMQLIFSGFRSQSGLNSFVDRTLLLPAARGTGGPWELYIGGGLYGVMRWSSYSGFTTYTMHSIKVVPEYIYQ